ncbi:unnamed protein product [Paramecium sonneborni]|uniref:Uncharacterized protein n=1 Tax=Paramecium sonneborni TaxID=65129 RepID=A0A8S1QU52_9CILI|nr:unnamed protein product [Paramecium sonneborni]
MQIRIDIILYSQDHQSNDYCNQSDQKQNNKAKYYIPKVKIRLKGIRNNKESLSQLLQQIKVSITVFPQIPTTNWQHYCKQLQQSKTQKVGYYEVNELNKTTIQILQISQQQ